jgi:hypothetical protein
VFPDGITAWADLIQAGITAWADIILAGITAWADIILARITAWADIILAGITAWVDIILAGITADIIPAGITAWVAVFPAGILLLCCSPTCTDLQDTIQLQLQAGLTNLGNSCYQNAIYQVYLFGAVSEPPCSLHAPRPPPHPSAPALSPA